MTSNLNRPIQFLTLILDIPEFLFKRSTCALALIGHSLSFLTALPDPRNLLGFIANVRLLRDSPVSPQKKEAHANLPQSLSDG